jgi:hypothetical protein
MAGVVLVAVSSGLSDVAQAAAAGVRDLAFAGMGVSVLLARRAAAAAKKPGLDLALIGARSTPSVSVPLLTGQSLLNGGTA